MYYLLTVGNVQHVRGRWRQKHIRLPWCWLSWTIHSVYTWRPTSQISASDSISVKYTLAHIYVHTSRFHSQLAPCTLSVVFPESLENTPSTPFAGVEKKNRLQLFATRRLQNKRSLQIELYEVSHLYHPSHLCTNTHSYTYMHTPHKSVVFMSSMSPPRAVRCTPMSSLFTHTLTHTNTNTHKLRVKMANKLTILPSSSGIHTMYKHTHILSYSRSWISRHQLCWIWYVCGVRNAILHRHHAFATISFI